MVFYPVYHGGKLLFQPITLKTHKMVKKHTLQQSQILWQVLDQDLTELSLSQIPIQILIRDLISYNLNS